MDKKEVTIFKESSLLFILAVFELGLLHPTNNSDVEISNVISFGNLNFIA